MRLFIILAIVLIAKYGQSQEKKVIVVDDTMINSISYNNLWANNLYLFPNNRLLVLGWGMDNSTNLIQSYKYNGIYDIGLNTQSNYKLYLNSDTIHWVGSNQPIQYFQNKYYEIGGSQWDTGGVNNFEFLAGRIVKYDDSLNIVSSRQWGNTPEYPDLESIQIFNNNLYVFGTYKEGLNPSLSMKLYCAKLDTNLNLIWERKYPGAYQEVFSNCDINNNTIYMAGTRWLCPCPSEDYQHLLKKIDTGGNLLQSVYMPYKRNQGKDFLCIFNDSITAPKLVLINTEYLNEDTFFTSYNNRPDMRIRILDTNLNLLKTIILPLDDTGKIIANVKNIGHGKMLLVGQKFVGETSVTPFGGWACLIDTIGHVYWERTYDLFPHRGTYFTDGLALENGWFVLSGTALRSVSNMPTQEAIVVMVDSLGCLDTTGCYPLGIKTNFAKSKQPKLFPNPTTEKLMLEFDALPNANYQLQVVDQLGRTILQTNISKQKTGIPTAAWANGIYFITLVSEKERFNYKILKE